MLDTAWSCRGQEGRAEFRERLDWSLGAGVQVDGWRAGKGISVDGNREDTIGPVELAGGGDANPVKVTLESFSVT